MYRGKITKDEWLSRGAEPEVAKEIMCRLEARIALEIEHLTAVRALLMGEEMSPPRIVIAARYIAEHPEILSRVAPESSSSGA